METSPPSATLAVGDPRRMLLDRAAVGTLSVAALFVVFALAAKQVSVLYARVPWQDDPYDAVVSFTVFFVPLMVAVGLVRMSLCRRDQPLPIGRVLGMVRAGRVVVAAVSITLVADWISVGLRANRAAWNDTTAVFVVLLALVTAVSVKVGVDLHRAAARMPRDVPADQLAPDWLTDLLAAAERCSGLLGPLQAVGRRQIGWLDRRVVNAIRRHAVTTAAGAALTFGAALALNTVLREGPGPAVWLDVVVGASGMFAFLIVAGAYVGLVRSDRPVAGPRRRMVDAAVIGCAAVPVTLAFRDWLWWIVGAGGGSPARLAELLAIAAASAALIVFGAETLFRAHPRAGA